VRGTSTGFEVAPDWKPTAWGQIKASYSYLGIDLENVPGHTDTSAVSTYEGSSPRHQFALRGLLELSQGVQLDPTFRYVSALAARNVDSFGTIDLRVGWRTLPGLDVSVTLQSLFQSDHVEFAHDPPPPVAVKRSVYASIVWRR
jgi:iron complex outermembrane receptor protein